MKFIKYLAAGLVSTLLIACNTNPKNESENEDHYNSYITPKAWQEKKDDIFTQLRANPYFRVQEIDDTSIYIEIRSTNSFPSSDATPSDQLISILDELFEVLNQKNGITIQVEGHTDNSGNPDMNMQLSAARAKSVADYLTEKGLKQPISHIGFGADKPIANNFSKEGRSVNRRINLLIKPIISADQNNNTTENQDKI